MKMKLLSINLETFTINNLRASFLLTATLTVFLLSAPGCGSSDPDTVLRKAANSAAAGRWKEASEQAQKVVSKQADNVTARVLLGIAQHENRRSEKALENLEYAAKRAPDNFAVQYFYGMLLFEQQDYANALQPLRKAYDLRKDNPDLLILLSRCCMQQNLSEGTRYLQVLRRFRSYQNEPEVYNSLAFLWLSQREYETAEKYLLEAYDKAPENPVVLQNLGVFYDRYQQNIKKAINYYRQCVQQSNLVDDEQRAAQARQRLGELSQQRR